MRPCRPRPDASIIISTSIKTVPQIHTPNKPIHMSTPLVAGYLGAVCNWLAYVGYSFGLCWVFGWFNGRWYADVVIRWLFTIGLLMYGITSGCGGYLGVLNGVGT